MTGTKLAAWIRRKTHTNSTTYTDADLLVDINLMKDEIVSRIQQVRPTIFNITYLANLVLSSTSREYAIPTEALNRIVDLELKFTATGDFVQATHLARRHYKDALQETKIVNDFNNLNPKYFIRRKKIYVLSGTIIAVTDGFKLVYDRLPADLANLTGDTDLSLNTDTENGIPREFHKLWGRGVVVEYKDLHEMRLSKKELEYDSDLEKALDDFSIANLDEEVIGSLPHGSTRGDNGAEY